MKPVKRKKLLRVAILPTLLTLGNLLFGFLSVNYIFRNDFKQATLCIFIAMIFDALDGRIAKLTKSASNFGAQLDSLSDLITFGLAPALLIYALISKNGHHLISYRFTLALSAFYVICAALRLARFNIETPVEQISHEYFAGLPTPGAAGLLASLVLLYYDKGQNLPLLILLLPFILLFLSILMITRLRYAHLLNKISRTQHPFTTLLAILLLGLLLAFKLEETLCAIFTLYILSGPFLYIKTRLSRRTADIMTGEVTGTSASLASPLRERSGSTGEFGNKPEKFPK